MSQKPLTETRGNDPMERVKEDFRVFLWVIWNHLGLPEPTQLQYDIALYLQHGPKRAIIEAFRGVGKSFVTSAFVLWLLLRNPQLKIMIISASKERADSFSIFTRRLIEEVPLLHHLRPKTGQRDSVISFDVGPATADQAPSVKSVGITGQLTGSRADIIIADDVEIPSNSATQIQREKLSELVKEFDAVLKPLPSSRIIYLGTPQTEMSLYTALQERGYEIRIWPAEIPDAKRREAYRGRMAPYVERMPGAPGTPTDPRRFSREDLEERRISYGRAGYALQFMLDTSLSDALKYPLRLSDLMILPLDLKRAPTEFTWGPTPSLIVEDLPNIGFPGDRYHRPMWTNDHLLEYSGTAMSIDPAGRGADDTGYAIIKQLHGYLFVVAAGGLPGGYDPPTLLELASLAKRWEVNEIVIEANFGDGMFTELFKPVLTQVDHRCAVEEVKHSKQKEARIIDTLEPVMMQHRLIVDPRVIQDDWETAAAPDRSLFYQLTRITKLKGALAHDDRLDALAIAVAYWVEQLAQDSKERLKSAKEKEKDEELKKFIRNAHFPTMDPALVGKAKGRMGRNRPSKSVVRRVGEKQHQRQGRR